MKLQNREYIEYAFSTFCACLIFLLFVQVDVLRCHFQVKSQQTPSCARIASTITNLVTVKTLTSRPKTSAMGTTHAIPAAPATVSAHVTLAALAMATCNRPNQRESFTSVAGQGCEVNWI